MVDSRRAALLALPKAELHRHLRGSMPLPVFAAVRAKYSDLAVTALARPGLVEQWRRRRNLAPFLRPGAVGDDDLAGLFDYDDFIGFILTYAYTGFYFREADDFRLLADGVLADVAAEGIVYVELIVSLREYLLQGVPLPAMLAILDEAAARPGPRVRWIVDVVRDFGPEAGLDLLRQIGEIGCPSIVGLTIGGSEHAFPPAPYEPVFRLAREMGLRLTAHAGEAAGAESVRDALDVLGVERIGHGVRASEDQALVARLAAEGVPLEVCPTSNLRTALYPSYEAHPLRALAAAGVTVTINTDDPTFFGTTLVDEALRLMDVGLPPDDLRGMLAAAFSAAFDEPAANAARRAAFESAWERSGLG